MNKVILGIMIVLVFVMLAGCSPGPNAMAGTPDEEGVVAGFWRGLWNGIISPVTFIISLFRPNVQLYEVHNNGGWYNFGFILGVMIIFGGGAKGSSSRRSRD